MMAATEWFWMMEDTTGSPVQVSDEFANQRFQERAEAEAWVGEVFADLVAEGVDKVSLFEGDEKAYTMSLHAE